MEWEEEEEEAEEGDDDEEDEEEDRCKGPSTNVPESIWHREKIALKLKKLLF